MKKFKVIVDDKEVEVILASEVDAAVNSAAGNARIDEAKKTDAEKEKVTQLTAQVTEFKEKAEKYDAVAKELEETKGKSSASERYLNIFKMFEGKVPLEAVEDFQHIPLLKDLDFANAEAVQVVKSAFEAKYPTYFAEQTPNNDGNNQNMTITSKGGSGGGSTIPSTIKSISDLAGKSKADINAAWDSVS
jgi:hypothetical protein